MSSVTIRGTESLLGEVILPADKSIAHRAAILAALADGDSRLINFPDSADPQSTLSCLRQLGISIREEEDGILVVSGCGLRGLRSPDSPLDCGNSGTSMRLLAGVLAGQSFPSMLVGDASLSPRPMTRIAEPLSMMGANIQLEDSHAPIELAPVTRLTGIDYQLPVASAQVKSCILLAGLYAEGTTTVIESARTRDHTERMLHLDTIRMDGLTHTSVSEGHRITPTTWSIPGDFSAASFFLVAASIVPHAQITMKRVGLNPSRCGLIQVLRAMGAAIDISGERSLGGEPIGDIRVRSAALSGVRVSADLVPNLIDELPALAVAAAVAEGETIVSDASELRHKETDRIEAITSNLSLMNVDIRGTADGFRVRGGSPLRAATVNAFGDHRIAMALGIAALGADGDTRIVGADVAAISFPEFWNQLKIVAYTG